MLRCVPPATWREAKLVVIFKKGELPKNYRPIAILPIMYKLFSRMVCACLTPYIIGCQDVDQAAYRQGFSSRDHLLTVTQLIERFYEIKSPLWLGLVDFEKAFDMVEHRPLWSVLHKQGVPQESISLANPLPRPTSFRQRGDAVAKFPDH